MGRPETILVMISSRCSDPISFGGKTLPMTAVRKAIKAQIEGYQPFGKPLFSCSINEADVENADQDNWDRSLSTARDCDLMIALFNGHAGWSMEQNMLGICQAELAAGLQSGRGKVFIIQVPGGKHQTDPTQVQLDQKFRNFIQEQKLKLLPTQTGEDVLARVAEVLQQAIVNLVKQGVSQARSGKYDVGEALRWERMTLFERKQAMESALGECLTQDPPPDRCVFRMIREHEILFVYHGIPASMGTAAARELVGRPFIKDFEYGPHLNGKRSGPVHLIGCHKGVTETQAIALLGHPDVTTVKSSFGIYLVDNYQKIQLVFLANCRDATTTSQAVQEFFDWLTTSGEDGFLIQRAESRRKIIQTIAAEILL